MGSIVRILMSVLAVVAVIAVVIVALLALLVIAFVAAIIVLLPILVLVYLFVVIRPRAKAPEDKTLLCDYAHRGLHGNGVPENSLEAFDLACKGGYGIELDVQLSKDGEVVVFHDPTLVRMTGVDKKVCELDASELCELKLGETEQRIPKFSEVLELVDGRTPILVELKGETTDTSLCPKVAELLKDYKGSYCLESFNPYLIGQMKKLLPDSYRGLLYTNVIRDKKKVTPLNLIVTVMGLNFIGTPHFIAYNEEDRNALTVKITTKMFKAPKFVWTVKSKEALDQAHTLGETPIFEKIDRE